MLSLMKCATVKAYLGDATRVVSLTKLNYPDGISNLALKLQI